MVVPADDLASEVVGTELAAAVCPVNWCSVGKVVQDNIVLWVGKHLIQRKSVQRLSSVNRARPWGQVATGVLMKNDVALLFKTGELNEWTCRVKDGD